MRTINHPSAELKGFQRWIADRILRPLPVHQAAAAYEQGTSIKRNAELHVRSRFLLRMDFRDFFYSIEERDVLKFLSRQIESGLPSGWGKADSHLLAKLVCRNGTLTIGAASSPSLINRMCRDLDTQLHGLCAELGVTYSRYADDMFFSTQTPNVLAGIERRATQIVDGLDCPAKLRIKIKKTRHSSKKHRRVVTGLVLTSDEKLSVGRSRKREIRGMIHRFDQLSKVEQTWLCGFLSFCKDVEPSFIEKLYIKYGSQQIDRVMNRG